MGLYSLLYFEFGAAQTIFGVKNTRFRETGFPRMMTTTMMVVMVMMINSKYQEILSTETFNLMKKHISYIYNFLFLYFPYISYHAI